MYYNFGRIHKALALLLQWEAGLQSCLVCNAQALLFYAFDVLAYRVTGAC